MLYENILLALCIILNTQTAVACFEDSFNDSSVILAEPPPDEGLLFLHFPQSFELNALDSELIFQFHPSKIASYEFKKLIHIGVLLSKYGLFEESLTVFKKLYQEHPNDYATIIGLGTVYEFVGQFDEAKLFIEKAIKINPNIHNRSEWFHVKVLEAKIAIKADPNWLLTHNVMNFNKEKASPKESIAYYLFRDTIDLIVYQLNQILPFTSTPNFLIANILNEFGDLCRLEHIEPYAYSAYLITLAYDPNDTYKVQTKLKNLKYRIESYTSMRYSVKVPTLEDVFHGYSIDNSTFQAALYAKRDNVMKRNQFFKWAILGLICISVLLTLKQFVKQKT